MLIEKYREGLVDAANFNCAEKLLNLGNQVLELDLPPQALRLSAGFGAGMGIESVCGAVTGAIMILSAINVDTVARESKVYKINRKFLLKVEERLGTINCKELKAKYYDSESKCQSIIEAVIECLDENL